MNRSDCVRMLDECLRWADAHEEAAENTFNIGAFERMRRLCENPSFELKPKQQAWIEGVYEKLFGVPIYRNEWSAGLVPEGNKVPTPLVLQNLPKRPPVRRKDAER
jgi:hypothetical protein